MPEWIAKIIEALAWPATVLIIVFSLRHQLLALLSQRSSVVIKALGVELSLTSSEAQRILDLLLEEIVLAIGELKPDERRLFNAIRIANGTKNVGTLSAEVFPFKFERSKDNKINAAHESFRRLRDLRLIRPDRGGKWDADKIPLATRFVEMVSRLKPDVLEPPKAVVTVNRAGP
jgi:hypothetical protein